MNLNIKRQEEELYFHRASFVEPYHAIAGGTYSYGGMEIGKIINANYDLKFDENNIRIIIYFDSQDEPIKDVTYNIMTDRKTNFL